MIGENLHEFDVKLCEYALGNIRAYLQNSAFAEFVKETLDAPVYDYLSALDDDDSSPLLLTGQTLRDIASAFEGGPDGFDKAWEPDERLHRQSIDAVIEIRCGLTKVQAEEWAKASAEFAAQLEHGSFLGGGIYVVHDWVQEVRRLLRAMGAIAFLPHPEGAFPTPQCPNPPPLPAVVGPQTGISTEEAHSESLALQREIRDVLLNQRTVKDWYTTEELAQILSKAEYTVREWCRQTRINATKKGSGRGKYQSWVVSHAELLRIQKEGLLAAKY